MEFDYVRLAKDLAQTLGDAQTYTDNANIEVWVREVAQRIERGPAKE